MWPKDLSFGHTLFILIRRDRGKPRDAGETVGGVERVQVTADLREENCCRYRANPGMVRRISALSYLCSASPTTRTKPVLRVGRTVCWEFAAISAFPSTWHCSGSGEQLLALRSNNSINSTAPPAIKSVAQQSSPPAAISAAVAMSSSSAFSSFSIRCESSTVPVIGGQRAAIPVSRPSGQGLCHARHPRVIETLRQLRNRPLDKPAPARLCRSLTWD